MKFLPILGLASAVISGFVLAEKKPEQPERHVRFLAVGEMPPFRQEIRDNVRYELEPPAGSIPPRKVHLGFGDEMGESTSLRLGQISEPMKAPAGNGPMILRKAEDKNDAAPWLKIMRPEVGDFLVLLWRASAKGTWDEAKAMVLNDDSLSAPAGSVRVVNLSPVNVGIVIGKEKLILVSAKTIQRKIPVGADEPFQIVISDVSGNPKRLHSGTITQNSGERCIVLNYSADGESPRRPLKVSVLRESMPLITEKK